MKRISAAQHAAMVLKNHTTFSGRGDKEYRTFAKPGETQEAAVKRYMSALKRSWANPGPRQFPNSAKALESTKAYVEAYYLANFHSEMQGHDGGAEDYVRQLFGELSQAPVTWPESDQVEVEIQP